MVYYSNSFGIYNIQVSSFSSNYELLTPLA